MSTLIAIRDAALTAGGEYSPAKEKAANRGIYNGRSPLLHRRVKQLLGGLKFKLLFCLSLLCLVVWFSSKIGPFMGWDPDLSSSISVPNRYTCIYFRLKISSLSSLSCNVFFSPFFFLLLLLLFLGKN